jgi:pilus assembly protein CpaB
VAIVEPGSPFVEKIHNNNSKKIRSQKMVTRRTIVPIIAAVIIALVGSVVTYQWIKRQVAPERIVKVESEALPIAVAVVDLPWGTQLNDDKIKLIPFLEESVPSGHFTDLASLEGRVLISPMKKGEPILEYRLAPTSITTGGISAVLKSGKRALAVKGDKVIGLSGLIRPGNRVDVLSTLTDPRNKRKVTKIVLENILVLATGTEIQKSDKGESPVDVFTLEVTPEEGEKLALAATQGRLQFALRSPIDTENVITKGATIASTLGSFKNVTAQKSKTRSRRSVRIISGTKVRTVRF